MLVGSVVKYHRGKIHSILPGEFPTGEPTRAHALAGWLYELDVSSGAIVQQMHTTASSKHMAPREPRDLRVALVDSTATSSTLI